MTIFPNLKELDIKLGYVEYKCFINGLHPHGFRVTRIPGYDIFEIFGERLHNLKKLTLRVAYNMANTETSVMMFCV
jgi:hypothetical protein